MNQQGNVAATKIIQMKDFLRELQDGGASNKTK